MQDEAYTITIAEGHICIRVILDNNDLQLTYDDNNEQTLDCIAIGIYSSSINGVTSNGQSSKCSVNCGRKNCCQCSPIRRV